MSASASNCVTVIIPTTCSAIRRRSLWRAIGSLTAQRGIPALPLVVVNGSLCDENLFAELTRDDRIVVHRIAEAGANRAQYAGRVLVRTPWFGFLDDDDEYLPDSLAIRLRAIDDGAGYDAVITNGLRTIDGVTSSAIVSLPSDGHDAALALLRANWLASCGGLFRTATVGPEFFNGHSPFLEWTLVAARLALAELRLRFVDTPTYVINDTGDSASKSDAYMEAYPSVLRALAQLDGPPAFTQAVREKFAGAHHSVCEQMLARGRLLRAWRHHIASLMHRGGWRYAAYTRRLLRPSRQAD